MAVVLVFCTQKMHVRAEGVGTKLVVILVDLKRNIDIDRMMKICDI